MSKYLLLLNCSFFFASPVLAQQVPAGDLAGDLAANKQSGKIIPAPSTHPEMITVLANGLEEPVTQTGQSVSIINRDEIQQVQGADITRILQRKPGVTITRNGGVGSFAGVRLRGAEAEQLQVIIDGVRVADPASPGGGFDFGNLLPGAVGKLELLRGSNSTIWGSQAIGGVLVVQSLNNTKAQASLEYGARDTFYAQASGGLGGEFGQIVLDGAYYTSDGFSAAAAGTELDGFRQWQAGGRAMVNVTSEIVLRGAIRYVDGRLDIDGFPAPYYTLADTAEFQDTRELSGAAALAYSGSTLELIGSVSLSDTERDSFNPAYGTAPNYRTDGHSERADLRGKWKFGHDWALHFGGEYEWSRFSSSFDARKQARIGGAYAQIGFDLDEIIVLNAGVRLSDHNRFGSAVTFGADAAYFLTDDVRVRASFGEGFKAPTLFQMYSDFGNVLLAPERSTSFDLAIEAGERAAGRGTFAVSLFRRDSRDQIDFISCFNVVADICIGRPYGTYDNVGQARAQGAEIEGGYMPDDTVSLRMAYAFIDTKNRTAGSANRGNELARRPRHAASFSADWTPGDFQLGADLRFVSRSFDNAANTLTLDNYTTIDLRASWQVTDKFEIFGRVENVTGDDYQTAAGYGAPGRGVFVGVRAGM